MREWSSTRVRSRSGEESTSTWRLRWLSSTSMLIRSRTPRRGCWSWPKRISDWSWSWATRLLTTSNWESRLVNWSWRTMIWSWPRLRCRDWQNLLIVVMMISMTSERKSVATNHNWLPCNHSNRLWRSTRLETTFSTTKSICGNKDTPSRRLLDNKKLMIWETNWQHWHHRTLRIWRTTTRRRRLPLRTISRTSRVKSSNYKTIMTSGRRSSTNWRLRVSNGNPRAKNNKIELRSNQSSLII